jgi:hypothetical protein
MKHTPTTELPLPPVKPAAALVPMQASDAESATEGETGDGWQVLVPEQLEIAMRINENGSATIRQQMWPDNSPEIQIQRENLTQFLDGVCDVLGVPSFGGDRQ